MRIPLPHRVHHQTVAFVLVGLVVAACGHQLLGGLLALGLVAWLANVIQVLVTLQLNFLGSRFLTWRRRLDRSDVSGWQSWRRFQAARGAGILLNVALFPHLIPWFGVTASYWSLFVVCGAINFVFDRLWSFRSRTTTTPQRFLLAGTTVLVLGLSAYAMLDAAIVVTSLLMLAVTATTLVFQLWKWWYPENNDPSRYGDPDEPRMRGAVLVPMRNEEAVARTTLERLVRLDHPDYLVVAIVDHVDDPRTTAIVEDVAAQHPGRIIVCEYPQDIDVHNKPIALNAAVSLLRDLGQEVDWVGIADAEDVFHPELLDLVDYRFRSTRSGIVQCGVQLMNFSADPRRHAVRPGRLGGLRRWLYATGTGWWRVANVLEYFKWFQSRMKLQAQLGVMPLGGNTVFFRSEVLEKIGAGEDQPWDERCLTEDCKIGISASVLGYPVDVVYQERLVTREETPPTLSGLVRQRVRWMQGFIQVYLSGDWRALPSRGQRLVACYVLGFQFFQAASFVMAPIALWLAITHKAPEAVALLATLPLGLSTVCVVLDVLMLRQFAQSFGEQARLRDFVGVVLGAYPYQIVLSIAAAWAVVRTLLGRGDWVKTDHVGAHLPTASAHEASSGGSAVLSQ